MTILNVYYLVTRIRKLKLKKFHLMMLIILQIAYTMLEISYIFTLEAYTEQVLMI